MPLKIELKVGDNTMTIDGDIVAIDEQVVNLAKAWVAALPPADDADAERAKAISDVTSQVEGNTATLAATQPNAA